MCQNCFEKWTLLIRPFFFSKKLVVYVFHSCRFFCYLFLSKNMSILCVIELCLCPFLWSTVKVCIFKYLIFKKNSKSKFFLTKFCQQEQVSLSRLHPYPFLYEFLFFILFIIDSCNLENPLQQCCFFIYLAWNSFRTSHLLRFSLLSHIDMSLFKNHNELVAWSKRKPFKNHIQTTFKRILTSF